MGVLAVIPARYGSVRFPGKPLALLAGKPMIQHVYERVAKAARVDEVIVATDDERILMAVRKAGGNAVMTNPSARSGSERVAEVARTREAAVVINVQGDEPLVHPDMVDQIAEFLERHAAVPMASLMIPLHDDADAASPNVVKVVVDCDGYALYFSRAPIPYVRKDQGGSGLRAPGSGQLPTAPSPPGQALTRAGAGQPRAYKHIGLYGYQRHFLLQFPHLEPTRLEQQEGLEQLRALEHGHRIKLLETTHDSIGVDTPDDLARVELLVAKTMSRLNMER